MDQTTIDAINAVAAQCASHVAERIKAATEQLTGLKGAAEGIEFLRLQLTAPAPAPAAAPAVEAAPEVVDVVAEPVEHVSI